MVSLHSNKMVTKTVITIKFHHYENISEDKNYMLLLNKHQKYFSKK